MADYSIQLQLKNKLQTLITLHGTLRHDSLFAMSAIRNSPGFPGAHTSLIYLAYSMMTQADAKQAALAREAPPGTQPKLNNEHWQALIALHRILLHEHHDFFLASQHPSATPAARRLAIKYAMPARLWRHDIHSFLVLLRNRLPDLLDHMLAFNT